MSAIPTHGIPREGDWKFCLAVFFAVFFVYLSTLPRSITLEDSGMFVMSAYFAGVAHPPGYPLQSMLGKLFTLIPWGSIAFRVNLMSAVFGAATCAMLFSCATALRLGRSASVAAALCLGFSPLFWSQAIIAEVYTLHTFILFSVYRLCLTVKERGQKKQMLFAALLYGLGLSNHWPLMIVGAFIFLPLLWDVKTLFLKNLHWIFLCVLAGLLPYLYMIWRSNQNPVFNFSGPIDSLDKFREVLGRKIYQSQITVSPNASDPGRGLTFFILAETVTQFTWLGIMLGLAGCRQHAKRFGYLAAGGFVAAFLLNLFLPLYAGRPNNDLMSRSLLRVFPITGYCVLALWLGFGFQRAQLWLKEKNSVWRKKTALLFPLLFSALLLALNYQSNDRRKDDWAPAYAKTLLNSLEPNAVYVANGDVEVGALGYMHFVEKLRPDLKLYQYQGLAYNNSPFKHTNSTSELQKFWGDFIENNGPVHISEPLIGDYDIEDRVFYSRYAKKSGASSKRNFKADDNILNFIDRANGKGDLHDGWSFMHRQVLLGKFIAALGEKSNDAQYLHSKPKLGPAAEKALNSFYGRLEWVRLNIHKEKPEILIQHLEELEKKLDEAVTLSDKSLFYFLKSTACGRNKDKEGMMKNLERSVLAYPSPKNMAILSLLNAYLDEGRKEDYVRTFNLYYADVKIPPDVGEQLKHLNQRLQGK